MPAWFNIYSLEIDGPQDEAGIKAATTNVHKMIQDEENAGIHSDRIMVGGFSMGGALALYSGCTYPNKLGGEFSYSNNIFSSRFYSIDLAIKRYSVFLI